MLTIYRAQDRFDNRNEHYIGHCCYNERVDQLAASDLIIAMGPWLGQVTTAGYILMDVPNPVQSIIHVHLGGDELGSVYAADLAINCAMPEFTQALAELAPVDGARWKSWLEDARSAYLQSIAPTPMSGDVNLSEIICWMSRELANDAVMINGSGNNSG